MRSSRGDPAVFTSPRKRGEGSRMLPRIVTFWHRPPHRLAHLRLRSQAAPGHKVTVYSFEPLAGLPDGVGNAEAEAVLPHAFSEQLHPPPPDGRWRQWD